MYLVIMSFLYTGIQHSLFKYSDPSCVCTFMFVEEGIQENMMVKLNKHRVQTSGSLDIFKI
jgi:hypothetical protein